MQPNESDVRAQMHCISQEIKRIDDIVAYTYEYISKYESYLQSCDKKSKKNIDIIRKHIAEREQSVQTLLQGRADLTMKLRKLNTKLVVQRRNMRTYSR